MKRILIVFTLIMSLFLLGSCNKNKGDSIVITSITPGRKDAHIELKVNNNKQSIEEKTIQAVVYYENNKVSTFNITINEDEDDETLKEYIISVTGLNVNKTYTVEITALVNKVRKTVAKGTFKTTSSGGTEDEPKLIVTVEDFLDMEKDETAFYRLENDLDFTGVNYKTIFATASKNFKGELDGNGKTLSNITITERTTYSGIIGRNSGLIKNLNIKNIKVDFTKSTTYSQYTSLVVGRNVGKIENVKVNGEITLNFNTSIEINIGGIAAVLEGDGSIKNSEVDMSLAISITSRASLNIGGIVGKFREGYIENVIATSDYDIANAESSNIGGAFGLVEYPNRIKGNQIEVDSKITLKTKVTAISTVDKTLNISVGGFAGRLNDSRFDNVYTKTNIEIIEPQNTKPFDVSTSRLFVGGLVGVSNNLTLNESVVEGAINLVPDEENNSYDNQFEQVFVGGLVGDSQNGRFGKVFNKGMIINASEISKEAIINPLIGKEINTKVSQYAYDNFSSTFSDIVYNDREINYFYDFKYRVTLDYGYENTLENTFFVDGNKAFSKPNTPRRTDYKFIGWYDDEGIYPFTKKVTENIHLTAHWKSSNTKYYIGFNLGYETDEVINPIELLESKVITPEEPTRAGYKFMGWFEKSSYLTAFDFSREILEDCVFIAKWELNEGVEEKLTVDFEIGFESDYEVGTIIVDESGKISAPTINPEKEGFVFMGWYLNGELFDFDTEIESNILLVARWYYFETKVVDSDSIDIDTWFTSEWIINKLK